MSSGGREGLHSCAAGALMPLTGAQLPGPGTPECLETSTGQKMGRGRSLDQARAGVKEIKTFRHSSKEHLCEGVTLERLPRFMLPRDG